MSTAIKRPDTVLIETLPEGQWRLRVILGLVVAVCPKHAPRFYKGGKRVK